MKAKVAGITVLFALIICGAAAILYTMENRADKGEHAAKQIVALNEITQLARSGDLDKMSEKERQLQEGLRQGGQKDKFDAGLFFLCGICLLFLLTVFGYIYVSVLRPFERMKQFAEKIAQGNMDFPLEYTRSGYFGAFTWAFDSMRREIIKARACEREAIENNKTVIATLSHDIKTPIASIRAYAEGLEAGLDDTPEKRQRYVSVLMKKCDEVSRLTNDLFLHSLSDLDKLQISQQEVELGALLENAAAELSGERGDLYFEKPESAVFVMADPGRLLQLVENLVGNARKYARSRIEIGLSGKEGMAVLSVRDYGSGLDDEDVPFIFDKFYRGKNCGKEPGSGLGLYIVKYLAERMGGTVSLHNHADGLEVLVCFPEVLESQLVSDKS